MNPRYQDLLEVLQETRSLLARTDNNFDWASWGDQASALKEIDSLISRIAANDLPGESEIDFLFAPTGPLQETSLSSGWANDFLVVAKRFDHAVKKARATGFLKWLWER